MQSIHALLYNVYYRRGLRNVRLSIWRVPWWVTNIIDEWVVAAQNMWSSRRLDHMIGRSAISRVHVEKATKQGDSGEKGNVPPN